MFSDFVLFLSRGCNNFDCEIEAREKQISATTYVPISSDSCGYTVTEATEQPSCRTIVTNRLI